MPTLPLPRHALAGGPADAFMGRGWRMSRPAIVVSVLAHLAVLIVASRWYEGSPAPVATRFEWLTVVEPPAPVVEPIPDVVEPAAPVVAPAPAPRAVPRAVQP